MILWYYLKVIVLENSCKAFSIGLSVNHYAQLFQPPKNQPQHIISFLMVVIKSYFPFARGGLYLIRYYFYITYGR